MAINVKLWRAKREFSQLIVKSKSNNNNDNKNDSDSGSEAKLQELPIFEPWLDLLRQNNQLAQEKIRCRIAPFRRQLVHPLVYLLLAGADRECIQEVYDLFPDVLALPIKDDTGVIGLPLHAACASRSACEGGKISERTISFLIEAYPDAVLIKNSKGALPIHELLQNPHRSASFGEVVSLLDAYEEGMRCGWNQQQQHATLISSPSLSWAKKGDRMDLGAPLSLAFRNDITQRNVLALLTTRFPKECNTLLLGNLNSELESSNNCNLFTINHMHARLIGKVLPQLTTFHCAANRWCPRALHCLMKGLAVQKSLLVNLNLRLPPNLPFLEEEEQEEGMIDNNDTVCHHLQRLVEENTTLQYLKLDFGSEYTSSTVTSSTASNTSICDYNTVGRAVGGVELTLKVLVEALRKNRSLKECHFRGDVRMKSPSGDDPNFFTNYFWPTLGQVLREHNTMLETITVSFCQQTCPGLEIDMHEVSHWCGLNPFGRALFQDPKTPFANIVSLLGALNDVPDLVDESEDSTTDTTNNNNKRLTVLYGLLRETPSLWLDKVKQEPDLPAVGVTV